MRNLVALFTTQLRDAIKIGEKATLTETERSFSNIVITGVGGSGIGGTIVSEIISSQSKIPIVINKNYFLPEFVNENTLVIVSSYSGDTEEALEAFASAQEKKAKIVCITSGGKILEISKEKKIDHIVLPDGFPPRSCLSYSLIQIFFILHNFRIINDIFKKDLQASVELIEKEEEDIQKKAQEVAQMLFKKFPIIYSPAGYEGVAIRFRQQLNENSKILTYHNTIPEMNHNELVGWTEKNDNLAVIIFRNDSDYNRISKRIEITKEIISKYTSNITEIYSKGDSIIEKTLYHIHIGDWISVMLAEIKKIDPEEIDIIDYLKSSLSNS